MLKSRLGPLPQPVIVTALILVLVGGVVAAIATTRDGSASPARQQATGATVTVTRGDLLQTQQLTGAVGYGSPNQVTGHGGGTITWLPSPGLTVKRGGQLFRVDDQPVSLLYGGLPLYRTLTPDPGADASGGSADTPAAATKALGATAGPSASTPASASPTGSSSPTASDSPAISASPTTPASPTASASPTATSAPQPLLSGHDVDLVAANMAALGFYHGPTTGVSYGPDLASAVRRWQQSIGAQATGILTPDNVVVTDGPVRVDSVTAQVGSAASGPVLTVTSTGKVITLQATADIVQALTIGTAVTVTLGDGTTVVAHVQQIGEVEPSTGGSPATAPITVQAQQPAALASAPLGAVTAAVVTASAKDVLYVPVAGLLALSGGGYALELTDKSLVRVTIGMVANGQVEVSGVPDGTKVLVAQ